MRGSEGRPRIRLTGWSGSRWLGVALLLVVLVTSAACATGNANPADPPTRGTGTPGNILLPDPSALAVDAYLTQQLAAHKFSGSALVARDGVVLLSKGYGMADWARQIPNTPQTQYRIGSLSKSFTAMLTLLLQAQGKLHTSDHICGYLPTCPSAWQPITIGELLSHTSGIPDLPDAAISDYTKPMSSLALLGLIARQPLRFAPGTNFSYSSAGYNVLGVIIERVTGESYADALRQYLFAPLHLSATSYDGDHPAPPVHADGYTTWQAPAPYLDMSLPFAAGSIASTVGDLFRWGQALSGDGALPSDALSQMFTPRAVLCPRIGEPCPAGYHSIAYGYGWYVEQGPLGATEYHYGELLGYRAFMARYPDRHLTVILLCNLESADAPALRMGIERILVPPTPTATARG